ncbi:MAG: PAS domain-containing protein [Janthinobacterium lividum]
MNQGEEDFRLREAEYRAEIARLRAIARLPSATSEAADHVSSEIAGTDAGEDPFFAAVQATRMPMIVADPRLADTPVVFVNNAFCRLTGYAREEIIGRNCRFLQCPETDAAAVGRIRAAIAVPESIEIDIQNARKDGTRFWNRLLLAPVHDAGGKLTYFFASQVDVTLERERLAGLETHNAALLAEVAGRLRAQQEGEDRLRFATEAGRLGVWDLDLRTFAMQASPRCAQNFGRPTSSPLTYADIEEAVHPDDRERRHEAVQRTVETGAPYDIEYRIIRPDGITGWLQVRAKVVMGADGRPHRLVGVSLDISDRMVADSRRRSLVELGDVIRDEMGPDDIAFAAARILGQALGVSRAGYGTIDLVSETMRIERDWNAPGTGSLAGVLHLRDYGSYIEDLKRGETVVFADAETDFRTAARADASKAIGARAVVNMPLTESGGPVALLYLNNASVRHWSTDDLAFVKEVAERTRVAVERRRAEQKLLDLATSLERRVEERTRERDRAWKLSRDLQAVIDENGIYLAVNEAWTTVLGWRSEQVLGESHLRFTHPDHHASSIEARRRALETGLPAYEARHVHADGSTRWISWVAASENGSIYASGRDVTQEREREAVLRDTQDFARLALSAVGGVGVWTYDASTDLFSYDAAIADLYALDPGRGASGIARTEFLANVHPDDRAALNATMAGGLRRPGDLELEYRICHPDGSIRWVLSRGHTYVDDDGRPIRRTGVGVETTKQRQTEEALRQSQKLEAVGQLTGGVAHDFNNLLTVIRSSTDLLKRANLSEERRARYVGAISDTVDRAAKLTGQLLAFARRQALKPEVFAVCDGVRALSDMIGTLTGSRIVVLTDLPEQASFVNADRSQFDTALVNMAVNARDAMDGEGQLTIHVEGVDHRPPVRGQAGAEGQFVAISVTDTGSGIPPERLDQIFEPFFTTKAVGQGTGLGLSQVFGFAKQSGGEVTVESAVGQGTTFTLYLPSVAGAEAALHVDEPEHLVDGHGTCVLIVEDNADVGSFAVQTLSDLGYQTVLAGNAEDALVELSQAPERFDVIFSDVVMPGMGGIELAREIRRRYGDLPVVLTSGYSHVLAQNGTYGFELLHKPYSVEQLSRILSKAAAWRLRRRSGQDRTT